MGEEFESFVCSALLHDIGKFVQRSYAQRAVSHWVGSEWFVSNNRDSFFDPALVQTLAGKHHEAMYVPNEEKPSAIEDPRQRAMAYLVSRADNLSASERPDSEQAAGLNTRAMLDSVFAQIDIGSGSGSSNGKSYKYGLGNFFTGDLSPQLISEDASHSEEAYQRHFDTFLSEFKTLFPKPYAGMSDTLANLIKKYLWCIPSDTTHKPHDVSLADHLCVTGAIAACFYHWHESNGWQENLVKDDSKVKVRLLCGDISGIQKYIYSIASTGVGGVAKRLRGRSFRISLLTDAIAFRLLRTLGLPLVCRIMSAGGQFYVLIPNTEEAIQSARNIIADINEWLLEEFKGELSISAGDAEVGAGDMSQTRFDQILAEARESVAAAKMRKHADLMKKGTKVFDLDYHGKTSCSVCGLRPANPSDDEQSECLECEKDFYLGQRLVWEKPWLVFSERHTEKDIPLFKNPTWYAEIKENPPDTDADKCILACSLRGGKLLPGVPSAFLLHAGYVPRWKNAEEVEKLKGKVKLPDTEELETRRRDFENGRAIKSFSALAYGSEGANLLGVLRADVDHLGFIFGFGLKEKASLSRIATLSSSLGIFFTRGIEEIISKEFPDTYTAYSGGDDLMLIGPWDKMVLLSKKIHDAFAKHTCNNPNITLSAGLANFHGTTPIAISSAIAGEVLEKAKESGRNSLSFFGSQFKWNRFDAVKEWMELLFDAAIPEEQALATGFIYRLMYYHSMARQYFADTEGSAKSAMYRAYMTYDLSRNFNESKLKDNPKMLELRGRLVNLISGTLDDWEPISAAASWCLYRLR